MHVHYERKNVFCNLLCGFSKTSRVQGGLLVNPSSFLCPDHREFHDKKCDAFLLPRDLRHFFPFFFG